MRMRKLLAIVLPLTLVLIMPLTAFAGNSFIATGLRVDSSSVYNARGYDLHVYQAAKPGSGTGSQGWLTTWLSLDLAQFNGQVYSAQFSQVGIWADEWGVKWFVYAEPGVVCLRGTPIYSGRGCIGSYGDLGIQIGQWARTELVTYNQGFWIARVYGPTLTADVARISSASTRVYDASASFEEGYFASTDPHLSGQSYLWRPRYKSGANPFTLWPVSSGGINNYLYAAPPTICPNYYRATINLANDPRYWSAGLMTSGICSANPFF